MTEKSRRRWGLLPLLIVFLAACQTGTQTRPVATGVATPVATPIPAEPTATQTARPTAAPTATDAPTPTPLPTPTPMPTEPPPADDGAWRELHGAAMRPEFAGDLEALQSVPRYSVEVTVDPSASSVRGREIIAYVNNEAVLQEAVYLRLFPNLPGYGGEMTVEDVRVDDRAARTELLVARTALRVSLPEPLAPGERATIALDFEVSVPSDPVGYGQFIFDQEIMALANVIPLIPAFDEENCALYGDCDGGWNIEYPVPYGDAVFSETALFDVLVTAPADWVLVASGSTIGQETTGAGDVVWHVVSGPMRDLNLVLSPRFQVAAQEVDGVVVRSYYLPEHEDGGRRVLDWAAGALAFFDEHFGPYPFAEFDIVETPNIAGGIEYPGLIAMPVHGYELSTFFFEWATIHEVSHQWWYSVVGNDQQDEPWLDEALAQYSTALYYESEEGVTTVVQEVLQGWYQPVMGTEGDGPFSLPVEAYTQSTYGPLVYGKGPLFFHAVRERVGLETFYRILQTYYTTYRYQVAAGSDWLAVADEVADEDLTGLFAEWIREAAGGE